MGRYTNIDLVEVALGANFGVDACVALIDHAVERRPQAVGEHERCDDEAHAEEHGERREQEPERLLLHVAELRSIMARMALRLQCANRSIDQLGCRILEVADELAVP